MNLIVTLSIGDETGYEPCLETIQTYADRIQTELKIIREPRICFKSMCFEKMQLLDYFDDSVDRILFLDRDVLVTPNAPDIFDTYRDASIFYAFEENRPYEWMDRNPAVEPLTRLVDWPLNLFGQYRYFNAGIFVMGKQHANSFKAFREAPNFEPMWWFEDQNCLNYLVIRDKIPFQSIDHKFNRMDLGIEDTENKRLEGFFIHYAGSWPYGHSDKTGLIASDYQSLMNEKRE